MVFPMKLIFCKKCQDVFRLIPEVRFCQCGKCAGLYLDEINAVYTGKPAYPLGINNQTLVQALENQPKTGMGECFEAFVIPKECRTFNSENDLSVYLEQEGYDATIRFRLPRDRYDFLRAIHGEDAFFALWHLDEHVLRGWAKYGHPFESPEEVIEEIRTKLREELRDRGIILDEIVGP